MPIYDRNELFPTFPLGDDPVDRLLAGAGGFGKDPNRMQPQPPNADNVQRCRDDILAVMRGREEVPADELLKRVLATFPKSYTSAEFAAASIAVGLELHQSPGMVSVYRLGVPRS